MWIRNKETGLIWEVTGELAERLSRSAEYEEVQEPSNTSQSKKPTPTLKEGSTPKSGKKQASKTKKKQ